jgi:hypothetical protein
LANDSIAEAAHTTGNGLGACALSKGMEKLNLKIENFIMSKRAGAMRNALC